MIYSTVSDFGRKQTPVNPVKICIEFRIVDMANQAIVKADQERAMLLERLRQHGYTRLDGTLTREYSTFLPEIIFLYTPGPRDILFKQFDKWIAPWQKVRDILFRRFK